MKPNARRAEVKAGALRLDRFASRLLECPQRKSRETRLAQATSMAIEITINGEKRTIREGSTLAELLVAMEVAQRPVAVEVNRSLVPRKEHAQRVLTAGDQLEVVSLVGGG